MDSRIQAFEILWNSRMQRPPLLTRTEEYDDPAFLMPDRSWLVRTTADMVAGEPEEEINVEAYWADVFGKAPEEQAVEHEDEMADWTDMFGDEDWDPLDYDDDAGEVYDMLLLE